MKLHTLLLLFLPWSLFAQIKNKDLAPRETAGKQVETPINYDEAKVPSYVLPDLLTNSKGQKVSSQKEWLNSRRPELLELFTTQVYGRVPATPVPKNHPGG